MNVSVLPRSPWMDSELTMVEDSCRQFYQRDCLPYYEEWEERGDVGRETWEKAGSMGLLGAMVPEEYGGPGGSFAYDAVIAYQGNLLGVDGWGGGLHNAIVIPYILNYGSEDQKNAYYLNWFQENLSVQ